MKFEETLDSLCNGKNIRDDYIEQKNIYYNIYFIDDSVIFTLEEEAAIKEKFSLAPPIENN